MGIGRQPPYEQRGIEELQEVAREFSPPDLARNSSMLFLTSMWRHSLEQPLMQLKATSAAIWGVPWGVPSASAQAVLLLARCGAFPLLEQLPRILDMSLELPMRIQPVIRILDASNTTPSSILSRRPSAVSRSCCGRPRR